MSNQQSDGQLAVESNESDTVVRGAQPAAPSAFEDKCLSLMEQTLAQQTEAARTLTEMSGLNNFIRQQQSQLYARVDQLYGAVSLQCQQLSESDRSLLQELQKFQTGGPQRAMSGLFAKLFRELIPHLNALDDIVTGVEQVQQEYTIEAEWLRAIAAARDNLERTLMSWGFQPVAVEVGREEFDPEIHHSVAAQPGEIPDSAPEHIIVKVRRRGWMLNEQILQHPEVVVS